VGTRKRGGVDPHGRESVRGGAVVVAVVALGVLAYFSLSTIRSSGEEPAPPNAAGGSGPATDSEPRGDLLRITDARWEGERAVVEGSWEGELSTVYCGLHRSRDPDSVADWWDRSRGPTLVWSERTFEQEFVEDEGREAQEPLDPEADYSVRCSGTFAGGRSTDAVAPVRWR
jgi:hypothetical protein